MTPQKFSHALGNIDEHYINEAIEYTTKKKFNPWVKWGTIAACLLLIITGVVLGNILRSPNETENTIMSYFVITVHAENGTSTELLPDKSCFNSNQITSYNVFDVDMPLFHFSLCPSTLKGKEDLYSRFEIFISYNGTIVKDKDEHLLITRKPAAPNVASAGEYSILGWFSKPTEIVIVVTDKKNQQVVETITVTVSYFANREEYIIAFSDLNTQYLKIEAENEPNVIETPRPYVFKDSKDILKPSFALYEDGKFFMTFSALSSYIGYGSYTLEDGRLTLKTGDGKFTYCFDAVGETFVFDGEASSKMCWFSDMADGCVFE